MKTLLFSLLLSIALFGADSIQWERDYQHAVQKAAQVNKPVFFVISSHDCRWCRRLETHTFSDPEVIAKLNAAFVNVIAYVDAGDFVPNELASPGTPTLWFLDTKGRAMFNPIEGSVGPTDFLKATDIVLKAFRQNALKQQYGNRKQ